MGFRFGLPRILSAHKKSTLFRDSSSASARTTSRRSGTVSIDVRGLHTTLQDSTSHLVIVALLYEALPKWLSSIQNRIGSSPNESNQ